MIGSDECRGGTLGGELVAPVVVGRGQLMYGDRGWDVEFWP